MQDDIRPIYIFLNPGDEIIAGDEFWSRVHRKWVNCAFPGGKLTELMVETPYRRKMDGLKVRID